MTKDEPVATVMSESGADVTHSWWHEPALPIGTKLYTAPQRTEEDDEFERIKMESGWRKRQAQAVVEDDDDIQDYKKPWRGLTDEERDYFTYIDAKDKARFRKYANYIETKLKEKNT